MRESTSAYKLRFLLQNTLSTTEQSFLSQAVIRRRWLLERNCEFILMFWRCELKMVSRSVSSSMLMIVIMLDKDDRYYNLIEGFMTKTLICLALLACLTQAVIRTDIVHKVPVFLPSFRDIVIASRLMSTLDISTLPVPIVESITCSLSMKKELIIQNPWHFGSMEALVAHPY